MQKLFKILQSAILTVLLVAALNLSFNSVMPDIKAKYSVTKGSFLDERNFYLLPFGEKEVTSPYQQPVFNIQTLTCGTYCSIWLPLLKNKVSTELFSFNGLKVFKEHPFFVLVRKLRI
ncbi:MAG: hypothetical protein ACM3PX_02845 [Omnitrophica WOR_2 bacterium]|jgi:hypothetical protein